MSSPGSDELAVAISELRVYRNGVEFTVSARCRGQLARHGDLYMGLSGHPHPRHPHVVEPFLLGFEFSDGRAVSNLEHGSSSAPDLNEDDHGPWLTSSGGGGSDRRADHDFFLTPLPPGDALTLIAAWPAFGIDETRHPVDAAVIVLGPSR